METSSAERIRSFAAREYIETARRKGLKRVQITAGDVHRSLRLKNRVPNVCSALSSRIFLEQNHLAIEEVSGPPSGMGTRVIYTYRLLEGGEVRKTPVASFENLRGLLKEGLHSLGGGEAFLRHERNRFYDHETPEEK
jgi:hypothetical protein